MDTKALHRRSGSRRAVCRAALAAALPLWLGAANPLPAAPAGPAASEAAATAAPSPANPAVGAATATNNPQANAPAQPAGAATTNAAGTAEKASGPCAPTPVLVQSALPQEVSLGQVLDLKVSGLPHLLDQLKAPNCAGKKLVLFLDERPVPDLAAYPPTDPAGDTLRFTLKPTEKSRDAWIYLLSSPTNQGRRTTRVSIGLADGYAFLPDTAPTIQLAVIPWDRFVFWALLLGLLLIAFFVLAKKSELLRDPGPPPGNGKRRPFSLARSQAAWWFFLVLASYLFIGLITLDFTTTITSTVLVLLGISAGTVVGSAAVDASKASPADPAARAAKLVSIDLQQDVAPQDKASQRKAVSHETESFLLDILSDADGVNFHRFQNAAWTVVLGIIFVSAVYRQLTMPTFDNSLLALMGISAGTYLGLKINEPTLPTTQTPTTAPPANRSEQGSVTGAGAGTGA